MGEIGQKHTKKCKWCKRFLPLDNYSSNPNTKDRLIQYCKACKKAYSSDPVRKEQLRAWKIKQKYGLDKEMEKSLDRDDTRTCQICGKKECDNTRGSRAEKLSIDHCHDHGDIRGLLCHQCNSGLGKFRDNLEGIMRVVEYLKREPFYLREDLHPCKITLEWSKKNGKATEEQEEATDIAYGNMDMFG